MQNNITNNGDKPIIINLFIELHLNNPADKVEVRPKRKVWAGVKAFCSECGKVILWLFKLLPFICPFLLSG